MATPKSSTPFFAQWENLLQLLNNGPVFPSHLRIKCPDTVFINDLGFPTSHFISDSSFRLQSKSSVHLTLDQVCTTLIVKTRAAEAKLKKHHENRTNTQRSSPIATPPTVRIALIGSNITGSDKKNVEESQNSRTLLLTADAFEELCRRWSASEVEKKETLPRCLQMIQAEPNHGVSYITCLVQPGFSPYSVSVTTFEVKLSTRLGLVAELPIKKVLENMKKLSSKNSIAIRLKRSIVGLAAQIGKTNSKKVSKIHGLVLEFIVTEDSHVELIKICGTHFRGERPSWSNPKHLTKEQKEKMRRRTEKQQLNAVPVAQRTHDDFLSKALMSKARDKTKECEEN